MAEVKAHIVVDKKLFIYKLSVFFMNDKGIIQTDRNIQKFALSRKTAISKTVNLMGYIKDKLLYKEGEIAILQRISEKFALDIIDELERQRDNK